MTTEGMPDDGSVANVSSTEETNDLPSTEPTRHAKKEAAEVAVDIPSSVAERAVEMTNRMFYEAGATNFTASHMQWVYRENCKLLVREAELSSLASSLQKREQALSRREGGKGGTGKGGRYGGRRGGRIPEANEFD